MAGKAPAQFRMQRHGIVDVERRLQERTRKAGNERAEIRRRVQLSPMIEQGRNAIGPGKDQGGFGAVEA